MASQSISLRIPREMRADIEAISRRTGRDFSSVAKEMLAEAIKDQDAAHPRDHLRR